MQRILEVNVLYDWYFHHIRCNYYPIGMEIRIDLSNPQAYLYIPFGKQFIVTIVDHNMREQFPLRWYIRDVNDIDYFNRIISTQTVLLPGIPWVYNELFYSDQGFY